LLAWSGDIEGGVVRYPAVITREGPYTLAQFPDCPGCVTQADPGELIGDQAAEALEGWLGAHLITGDVPPRPRTRAPRGKVIWVDVPPRLAAKLEVRWARQDAGLTQSELGRRAGVTQQMIAKVEHPNYSPSLDVLDKVVRALGARLEVSLRPAS